MRFIKLRRYDTYNGKEDGDVYIRVNTIVAICEQQAGSHQWRLIWLDGNFNVKVKDTVEEIMDKIEQHYLYID